MTEREQILVVGSYVQDQAWFVERFPRLGETMRAHRFNTGPGGKGFNQAVASARQGVPTAFIGAIGNDPLGGIAQAFARAQDLPCRWQIRDDQPTAASSITVNVRGENQIALSLGANEHLDPQFVRSQSDLFEKSSLLLVQLENNLDAIDAALEIGARCGLVRVLNPAPVHAGFHPDLLHRADIITPNETEFSLLLERCAGIDADPATLTALDDLQLHTLSRALNVATVVITLGANGCFVSHGKTQRGDTQAYYRLAPEKVNTIDTTGAGDSFSGSLVAAMLLFRDAPFRDAVVHANRAAALSTEIVGTAPAMATFAQVRQRFPR
jgi:ribokinase